MATKAKTVVTTIQYNRLPQIAARLPVEAGNVCAETAARIRQRVEDGMRGTHGGQSYGAHVASAPGEMPAVDSGKLLATIKSERDGVTAAVVTAGGPSAEYAVDLEYGTTQVAARPYMTPAAEAERAQFVAEMAKLEARLG